MIKASAALKASRLANPKLTFTTETELSASIQLAAMSGSRSLEVLFENDADQGVLLRSLLAHGYQTIQTGSLLRIFWGNAPTT